MTSNNLDDGLAFLGFIFLVVLGFFAFGGWLQHLYTCFTDDRWGFLIAGALFFPIGIIHGWGIWFGFWT